MVLQIRRGLWQGKTQPLLLLCLAGSRNLFFFFLAAPAAQRCLPVMARGKPRGKASAAGKAKQCRKPMVVAKRPSGKQGQKADVEVVQMQCTGSLVLERKFICRAARDLVKELAPATLHGLHMTDKALYLLQKAAETTAMEYLTILYQAARHASRTEVTLQDHGAKRCVTLVYCRG